MFLSNLKYRLPKFPAWISVPGCLKCSWALRALISCCILRSSCGSILTSWSHLSLSNVGCNSVLYFFLSAETRQQLLVCTTCLPDCKPFVCYPVVIRQSVCSALSLHVRVRCRSWSGRFNLQISKPCSGGECSLARPR